MVVSSEEEDNNNNNNSNNSSDKDNHDEHEDGCIDNKGCNVFNDYRFDEARIEELFEKLDVNKDGRLDVKELSDGLHRLKIVREPEQAEVGPIDAVIFFFFFAYYCTFDFSYLLS